MYLVGLETPWMPLCADRKTSYIVGFAMYESCTVPSGQFADRSSLFVSALNELALMPVLHHLEGNLQSILGHVQVPGNFIRRLLHLLHFQHQHFREKPAVQTVAEHEQRTMRETPLRIKDEPHTFDHISKLHDVRRLGVLCTVRVSMTTGTCFNGADDLRDRGGPANARIVDAGELVASKIITLSPSFLN